ncbi:MAG: FAD-binding oxidoreductase, partial [Planctomycetes bacterium]|nr:FAD-binding oxidoreductase [Planctomycetota bacterium]
EQLNLTTASRRLADLLAQAGILGETLERRLDAQGVTLGHFPSSIYCSTLGGWLAARSAGQLSTYYGKIEDRVLDLVLVTSEGETLAASELVPGCPAAETAQLVLGTEGTAAVIVEAELAVHPKPESREFLSARFRTVERGLDSIRDLLQAGVVPAAVRLYDHLDTLLVARPHRHEGAGLSSHWLAPSGQAARHRLAFLLELSPLASVLGPRLPGGCLMVLTFEGPREVALAGAQVAAGRFERSRAVLLGPGPARDWWEHRYDVSYKQSPVYDRGGLVDTIEVAATWDRLVPLYRRMRAAIGRRALVLAHFSHAYQEGCSIYFTFIHRAESFERARATYARVWRLALDACLAAGGTITHHHGVGLLKRAAYAVERKGAWQALETLSTAFDPAGILNPGKLGKPLGRGPNPACDGL